MATQEEFETLENELRKLVGEICTRIHYLAPQDLPISSPGYYRPFLRLKNNSIDPLISLIFGIFEKGESFYSLGIFGLWTILKNGEPVCEYIGALDSDGMLLQQINLLKSYKVEQIILDKHSLNLFIGFEKDYQLAILQTKGLVSGFRVRTSENGLWEVINGEINEIWELSV